MNRKQIKAALRIAQRRAGFEAYQRDMTDDNPTMAGSKLGSRGPASGVRRIDPASYQAQPSTKPKR